jgi:hypothetical protein
MSIVDLGPFPNLSGFCCAVSSVLGKLIFGAVRILIDVVAKIFPFFVQITSVFPTTVLAVED